MAEPTNKGALLLREKTEARGAKAAVAREFDVDPALVSRWLSGDRLPEPKQRARFEDDYDIPWRLWDESTEPEQATGAA